MSYRRSSYFRPYTTSSSRARGNQRAADQQRDTAEVVLNHEIQVSCGQTMNFISNPEYEEDIIDAEEYIGWKDTGCAAINMYEVLRQSEFFSSYANMYDQVRIDAITAKITALSWVTGTGGETENTVSEYLTPKSLTVVTAWDRSGVGANEIKKSTVDGNPVFYCTISKNITSYSSAKIKHLGPGSNYEITRYLYPSSLLEKGQFVNTTDLVRQYIRDNTGDYTYREFKWTKDVNGRRVGEKFVIDSKMPTNLMSNPGLPFKPTLLINVVAGPDPSVVTYNDEEIGVNKLKPTTFNIEFNINVTFRGLRYNKII